MSLVNMTDDNLSSIVYKVSSSVEAAYLVSLRYVMRWGRVAALPRVCLRQTWYSVKWREHGRRSAGAMVSRLPRSLAERVERSPTSIAHERRRTIRRKLWRNVQDRRRVGDTIRSGLVFADGGACRARPNFERIGLEIRRCRQASPCHDPYISLARP